MICTRCGKKLSRKTARQINGEVLCSPCVFPPMKPRSGQDRWHRFMVESMFPKGGKFPLFVSSVILDAAREAAPGAWIEPVPMLPTLAND